MKDVIDKKISLVNSKMEQGSAMCGGGVGGVVCREANLDDTCHYAPTIPIVIGIPISTGWMHQSKLLFGTDATPPPL